MGLVAIDLLQPAWTSLNFAVALDVATMEICGLSIHEDHELARMFVIFDTVRDNGWCVPHGRPETFVSCCGGSPVVERIAAKLCGSKLGEHGADHVELMGDVMKGLGRHLDYVSERGKEFGRLYAEAVNWAVEFDRYVSPAVRRWDWSEMNRRAGELPAFLSGMEFPEIKLAEAASGSRIEFEGEMYQHPWIETFTQQALPGRPAYSVCSIPTNKDELWLIMNGGCFAATKVAPEKKLDAEAREASPRRPGGLAPV
ncbi:hypothetical protein XH94_10845 [Bradyrhizobium zhanjiangense]|uniref:Uncharacterized protein n=2 Tax=Bradyrhizobium zhanjiangense TaxID=1325107 RepID=A0A4Q0SNN2_9BRAD|nr:hypothetical protein XH94_10845 [Bradyrhizobium zhanjiangense]